MARILYISHDNPRPSGGTRTLYRHVEFLCQAGFDAHVVHLQSGFRIGWFASTAPVLYAGSGLPLHPEDWIVIPEDHRGALEGFRQVACRKALFCQGHFHIFDAIPPQSSLMEYGISEILVSSIPIRDFVRWVFGVEPSYVPLSLDHALFQPATSQRRLQLAFMPRKGSHHLRLIQGILHHRAADLRKIPWMAIENRAESEVPAILRASTFFLSTGFQEGFGLPPLEAMACGAMVVGFRAGGGSEYATSDNGFWIADEDTLALADKLLDLLRSYERSPADSLWENVRLAGFVTAARYSQIAERTSLIRFWSERAATASPTAKDPPVDT